MTKFTDIVVTEVAPRCFIVEALVAREWLVHEGPAEVAYFTRAEAERFAARVRKAGEINLDRWYNPAPTHEELEERWDAYAVEERGWL